MSTVTQKGTENLQTFPKILLSKKSKNVALKVFKKLLHRSRNQFFEI